MKLFELYAELGLDSSGFDKGIKKASKAGGGLASSLRSGIGGASNYVGKQISATTVMLGNLMADAARKGADLVKSTASAGIKYNASMETYVTNFKTMLGGSSEAAQQLTSDLEDMAASTPFAMSDLAGATNTLLAFGQSSDTVLDTLESLGDISMGDANKLQSLTLAFAQASSSGKLMGQDLMQMINAGFNPLQTIVEKTGASMGDLKEFMSTGKASKELKKQMKDARKEVKELGDNASDGAKMLVQMYEDGAISADLLGQVFDIETSPGGRFYNAMKAASETFDGLMSTLEDDSNALLGKVFKPLSDWMTTDFLPNAIGAIGQISAAFDEGGLEGAVNKAVEIAGGYLDSLGAKALETGSGMLANILTGLTGDTVTGPEITAFFAGIWNDASGTADTFISNAGGVLKGIWDGLTGDTTNKTNIVGELDGIWDSASESLSTFTDAAGGLLGTIWTKLTGSEATPQSIGEFIGGAFKTGADAIKIIVDSSSSLMRDIAGAIRGDQQSIDQIKQTFDETFASLPTAMDNAIDQSGGFLSRLYENITGDKEGAAKLQALFDKGGDKAGQTTAETVSGVKETVEKVGAGFGAWKEVGSFALEKGKDLLKPLLKNAENAFEETGISALFDTAKAWADEHGITKGFDAANTVLRSQIDPVFGLKTTTDLVSDLGVALRELIIPEEDSTPRLPAPYRQDPLLNRYFEEEYGSSWKPGDLSPWGAGANSYRRNGKSPFADDGAEIDGLPAAIAALTAAAASLASDAAAAATAALNGSKVEMDGVSVGRIVLPYVSQALARGAKVMQKAHP